MSCKGVRKVFRTYHRKRGFRGLLANFFARDYVSFTALDGIDLDVAPGDFVGLIGRNGAGKTTLVKCLTGIIPVTSGSARLFSHDCFHLDDGDKRRLSLVMGQRSQLWWDLPAIDSFKLLREIYQVDEGRFRERVDSYAARLEVSESLTVQLRHLSLGQRMKMEIIGAFLHDPEVVFLDEPTLGLDLLSQETIRSFLRECNQERGATIVLTSHDMEDIEETCSRILILDSGRFIYQGDLLGLHRRLRDHRAVEIHLAHGATPDRARIEAAIAPFGATLVKEAPLHLTFLVPVERTEALVKALFDCLPVRDLTIERQPLEQLIREIFATREIR